MLRYRWHILSPLSICVRFHDAHFNVCLDIHYLHLSIYRVLQLLVFGQLMFHTWVSYPSHPLKHTSEKAIFFFLLIYLVRTKNAPRNFLHNFALLFPIHFHLLLLHMCAVRGWALLYSVFLSIISFKIVEISKRHSVPVVLVVLVARLSQSRFCGAYFQEFTRNIISLFLNIRCKSF